MARNIRMRFFPLDYMPIVFLNLWQPKRSQNTSKKPCILHGYFYSTNYMISDYERIVREANEKLHLHSMKTIYFGMFEFSLTKIVTKFL